VSVLVSSCPTCGWPFTEFEQQDYAPGEAPIDFAWYGDVRPAIPKSMMVGCARGHRFEVLKRVRDWSTAAPMSERFELGAELPIRPGSPLDR
jgi:hypothetical protein